MKISINANLKCIVDTNKDHCFEEPPHCHITHRGERMAQIWLDPVRVQPGCKLDRRELMLALGVVEANRHALEQEYLHNRFCGAD